jgi:predicted transposase/invertase (TIGR01784 family)
LRKKETVIPGNFGHLCCSPANTSAWPGVTQRPPLSGQPLLGRWCSVHDLGWQQVRCLIAPKVQPMPQSMSPRSPKIPSVLRPYDRKFASPRVDIMFKRVFGTEKNKPILMAFLQEITRAKILDLVFENTELADAAEEDGKTVRLDVLATVQTGTGPQLVNIEVQNVTQAGLVGRALFYWARVYSSQLKAGTNYKELRPTLVIFLLNDELFAGTEEHTTTGLLMKPKTGCEIQVQDQRLLELTFIELSKVRKRLDSEPQALKNLNRWLVFLAADSDRVLEELRMQTQDLDLDRALTEIEYAALSKRDKLLYQARMDAIREERSNIEEATATAAAKARAETLVEMANMRFGVLPMTLAETIAHLPSAQLVEVGRMILQCPDAAAFEAAVNKLKTRG